MTKRRVSWALALILTVVDDFTLGVIGASSTVGSIIPPSIPFVIFGASDNASVVRLFIGGFLPGLLMALALSAMVFVVARRRNYPVRPRAAGPEHRAAFRQAYLVFMPVIMVETIRMVAPTLMIVAGAGLCGRRRTLGVEVGFTWTPHASGQRQGLARLPCVLS